MEKVFKIGRNFLDDRRYRTDGNGCVERDVARLASHYLDDIAARMAFTRIAQLVDKLDDCIHCRVEPDCHVGGSNIIVDRTRDADAGDASVGQIDRAAESAVASDGDDTVDPVLMADIGRLGHALRRAEFRAARRIEHRAVVNAHHFHPLGNGQAGYGADGGVHAGRVPAGGQHAYALECFH